MPIKLQVKEKDTLVDSGLLAIEASEYDDLLKRLKTAERALAQANDAAKVAGDARFVASAIEKPLQLSLLSTKMELGSDVLEINFSSNYALNVEQLVFGRYVKCKNKARWKKCAEFKYSLQRTGYREGIYSYHLVLSSKDALSGHRGAFVKHTHRNSFKMKTAGENPRYSFYCIRPLQFYLRVLKKGTRGEPHGFNVYWPATIGIGIAGSKHSRYLIAS